MDSSDQLFVEAMEPLIYNDDDPSIIERSLRTIEALALNNCCNAIYELSQQYLNAEWRDKDEDKGYELLLKYFNCGCSSAASKLAVYFIAKSDWSNAIKYLNIGESNSEEISLLKLGELYEFGGFDGTFKKDLKKSLKFYERASKVLDKSLLSWQENAGKIGAYSVKIKLKNENKI